MNIRADQAPVVIEASDSSLCYARTKKARAQAASGVPEYGIVRLADRRVEALTEPAPKKRKYKQRRDVLQRARPSLPTGASLAVAEILP